MLKDGISSSQGIGVVVPGVQIPVGGFCSIDQLETLLPC